MVLTAFDVGESQQDFDLLIVDEMHRLNQRANQPAAALNIKLRDITTKLFGHDDTSKTQLDWITAKSTPPDLSGRPRAEREAGRHPDRGPRAARHRRQDGRPSPPLFSQMRVRAGSDYVGHSRRMLGAATGSGSQPHAVVPDFGDYAFLMLVREFRMVD